MLFKRTFFKPKPNKEALPDHSEYSDLGFDESFSQEKHYRFLNKDGSFNVAKKGLNFIQALHMYNSLLTMGWLKFYGTVFGTFVGINLLFATIFFLCGPGAVYGVNYDTLVMGICDSFFFSVQSFTTVGYGQMYPSTFITNVFATISSFVGLLSFALATGIFFARFSRPVTKVRFSEHAIISPFKQKKALIFRLVNSRAESELLNVSIKVVMTWFETSGDQIKRKFKTLSLERTQVTFMPAVWTVIHPIIESSPLHNKRTKDLEESDVEFLITLKAFDETFSQIVYKRSSYKWYELKWNANFVGMISKNHLGKVEVDVSKLDHWEAA